MRGTARRTPTPKASGDSSFGAFRAALEFVKAAGGNEAEQRFLTPFSSPSHVE
jgi:hypothetical protein